jgi:hypothetical protein
MTFMITSTKLMQVRTEDALPIFAKNLRGQNEVCAFGVCVHVRMWSAHACAYLIEYLPLGVCLTKQSHLLVTWNMYVDRRTRSDMRVSDYWCRRHGRGCGQLLLLRPHVRCAHVHEHCRHRYVS